MTATTHPQSGSVKDVALYVGFELSNTSWVLAMTPGLGTEPWVRTMPPGDWSLLQRVLATARTRFGLPATSRVISCYEAGRDGFWVHRALTAQHLDNRVVDSASIEVNRRRRRTKTDRVDACKLVLLLVRVCLGDRHAWREVRVPTEAQEAARQVSRDRSALVQERTRLINQLRGWLATWGTQLPGRRRGAWWTAVRDWAGAPLPLEVQGRLERATARLALLGEHLAMLDAAQQATIQAAAADSAMGRLRRVKGVAATSIATLLEEGLVWRQFTNRRQVGGILGFVPVPYASGDSARDQGISHAGNPRLQSMMVQLSWTWLRWQKQSALTQWYRARFGDGRRARRIGIVALARKLLIALWRWATSGVPPTGAIIATA